MVTKTDSERIADLERDVAELKQQGKRIANLLSTLGGKFRKAPGVLTQEMADFFDEVSNTLKSANK